MTFPRFPAALLLLAAVVWLAACDSAPRRYKVSGTVKYKGEPIKSGSIQFRSDKGDVGGAQITDGKYDIPAEGGLVPGNYKVAVNYPDPKVPAPKPGEPPGVAVYAKEMLPEKYNEKSELTAEIKPQNNEVNYDLK